MLAAGAPTQVLFAAAKMQIDHNMVNRTPSEAVKLY
jgi:hypothetical protein